MIISLAEIKRLLSITDTTQDLLISSQMPLVEAAICDYCNSDFLDTRFDYLISSSFSFNSSDNSINLTGIGTNLAVYDTIKIFGSARNDQAFDIVSLTTNKLIVNPTVSDEVSTNRTIYLARIKYPLPLKYIATKMIDYTLQGYSEGVKSEQIDDHSITYDDKGQNNGYPTLIMSALNSYRQVFRKEVNKWE